MGGAAGFLTADQFIYGADAPFSLGSSKTNLNGESSKEKMTPGEGEMRDEKQRPMLVTIFLRGGADAMNAIVPYGDKEYYRLLNATGTTEKTGVVKLKNNEYWGLNP